VSNSFCCANDKLEINIRTDVKLAHDELKSVFILFIGSAVAVLQHIPALTLLETEL
jgi:hypothetical protein